MMKLLGAALLLGGTLALMLMGDPGPEDMMRWKAGELQARLDAGEVQVDPGELLALMHDRTVRLRIADLRDEAEWNYVHLVDAERLVDPATWGEDLDFDEIVILVDRDGSRSPEAWRQLQARHVEHSYFLDGGMDAWLALFGAGEQPGAALGDRHPAALPDADEDLRFVTRVKRVTAAPVLSGGCG